VPEAEGRVIALSQDETRRLRNRARQDLREAREELLKLRDRDYRYRTYPGFYADEDIAADRASIAGTERRVLWLAGMAVAS
jgi:hypothetical protein